MNRYHVIIFALISMLSHGSLYSAAAVDAAPEPAPAPVIKKSHEESSPAPSEEAVLSQEEESSPTPSEEAVLSQEELKKLCTKRYAEKIILEHQARKERALAALKLKPTKSSILKIPKPRSKRITFVEDLPDKQSILAEYQKIEEHIAPQDKTTLTITQQTQMTGQAERILCCVKVLTDQEYNSREFLCYLEDELFPDRRAHLQEIYQQNLIINTIINDIITWGLDPEWNFANKSSLKLFFKDIKQRLETFQHQGVPYKKILESIFKASNLNITNAIATLDLDNISLEDGFIAHKIQNAFRFHHKLSQEIPAPTFAEKQLMIQKHSRNNIFGYLANNVMAFDLDKDQALCATFLSLTQNGIMLRNTYHPDMHAGFLELTELINTINSIDYKNTTLGCKIKQVLKKLTTVTNFERKLALQKQLYGQLTQELLLLLKAQNISPAEWRDHLAEIHAFLNTQKPSSIIAPAYSRPTLMQKNQFKMHTLQNPTPITPSSTKQPYGVQIFNWAKRLFSTL